MGTVDAETSGESDSTEFHVIGDEVSDQTFSYGEHKGKSFSEVAKKYPKYSRKFDGARKTPAWFKEYLEWLKTQ
eukprot:10191092-Karenia_brevis.AAC.1